MSNPRIIAGSARGIRIKPVPGNSTRPITDRVKEALFNILGQDILEATFWDLFGGTGSVGIEALSRGAHFCRFTENNQKAYATLKENLVLTKTKERAEVISIDAFKLLGKAPERAFDYIFIAPPQYKGMWIKALEILDNNPGWLEPDGQILVQIDPVEMQEIHMTRFEETNQRKYGSTLLLFYEYKAERKIETEE